jgi:hypothetical protein
MPFLHCARNTVIRDKAGTVLYEELLKGYRSGRDVGNNRNATAA